VEKYQRGLSPVISILLLIIITIAAAIIVYYWLLGYQGNIQKSASAKQFQSKIKINEVQKVLDYPNAAYEIWITNIGDVEVYLDDVYVLGPNGKITYWHYDPGNWSIEPGDTQFLWLWTGNALTPSETYVLKVVTSDGVEYYYRFKA